jgi:Cytochrome c3
MPQVFPRPMNFVVRLSLVGGALGSGMLAGLCLMFTHSSYGTDAGVVREQPIPFSHQHHVGVLGIDCRYCHTSVEQSSYAGMPPTKTCMNCHSQIWVGSKMLEPVRESYKNGTPLQWDRVYNLPGFVYFDHSIHINKGIGCSSCHGRIDEMPFTYQFPTLLMEWCLECHRHPERQIRPREEVFNIRYEQPDDQETLGRRLCKDYEVKDSTSITSCSVCHR